MKIEHITFLDNISSMPCSLRKLPEAFGLTSPKSWYPHYFNTKENLSYVGEIPYISYYGANTMSAKEIEEFLAWYEGQRSEVFHNRGVLEASLCLGKLAEFSDVSLLRLAMLMSS